MRRLNAKVLLLLALSSLLLAVVTSVARLQRQGGVFTTVGLAAEDDESSWPVADYAADLSAAPSLGAARRARNSRYDRRRLLHVQPGRDGTLYLNYIGQVPALPVAQSDVVLIGEVTDAKAYLSNDRVGIYSEFAVRVGEVLKDGGAAPVTPAASIVAEREGGRVRFPFGPVRRYTIAHRGMPQVGRRYLLFLKSAEDGQGFSIVTAYGLHAGRVSPLDGKGTKLAYTAYEGAEESGFVSAVNAAIAEGSLAPATAEGWPR